MFKIYDGRDKFYQWDSERKLIIEDPSITEVHFCNRTDNCSLVCETFVEDGLTLANVPNILLQTDWRIKVYAYDSNYTKYDTCYDVVSRTKPADYVYTETEIKRYEDLDARIKKLEDNPVDIPTKVSELENDAGYVTEVALENKANASDVNNEFVKVNEDISTVMGKADEAYQLADMAKDDAGYALSYITQVENSVNESFQHYSPKTNIKTISNTVLPFEFSSKYNTEARANELTSISFTFGDGVYADDYTSGIVFDSGATPTAIDYTDSGILNWVGTDCATADGLSIFQPSANTHYDIVFYFNGTQFIGLVNGFVPATGNVVS